MSKNSLFKRITAHQTANCLRNVCLRSGPTETIVTGRFVSCSIKADISKANDADELPVALLEYIAFIEQETNLPVTIVSVGPDRKQTLRRQLAV